MSITAFLCRKFPEIGPKAARPGAISTLRLDRSADLLYA
jgi:hypothetical protein